MTTQLVRSMAKDFAGAFYEQEQRTLRFRRENSDVQSYIATNWVHFVDVARAALAALLARPDYPEHLKEAISKDLIEDNERAMSNPQAQEVMQASLDHVEKDERRSLDSDEAQLRLPSVI